MLVLGGVVQKVDIRSAIGMEEEEGRKGREGAWIV